MMRKSSIRIYMVIAVTAAAVVVCLQRDRAEAGTSLCINEIMGKSSGYADQGGEARERWIELFNGTGQDISLEGYGLTIDMDYPYLYRFPDVTIESGGFLVVYATGKQGEDKGLYAPFELSAAGDNVALTNPRGDNVDQAAYGPCVTNCTYGRKPDGGDFALLNRATKGSPNFSNVSHYIPPEDYNGEALFSKEPGFYDGPFELELSCEKDEVIYYTLDGSDPDITSPVYKSPVPIYNKDQEPNQYAPIRTTERGTFVGGYGREPVKKAWVVRTRTARNGKLSRTITSNTYFVGEQPPFMVVSLVTDPDHLFDYFDGILVPGFVYGRFARSGMDRTHALGNFSLRGAGAERPVSVSFFQPDGSVFSQDSGLRITSGRGNTANLPTKSLRLTASYKNREQGKHFPASLFGGDKEHKPQKGYRNLLLRIRNQFVANACADVFAARLARAGGLKVQRDRPVIVYINGEYWGLAYLRDRIDRDFIEERFGIEGDNAALLKWRLDSPHLVLEEGRNEDLEDYLALMDYIKTHDLSVEENYQYVAGRMDIEDFIRNYIFRIFAVCRDWPDNNVRLYRAMTPDKGEYGDGKWRMIMFDNDFSFIEYEEDMLKYALGENTRTDNMEVQRPDPESCEVFKALMENEGFRADLRRQYEAYKETIFSKDYMNQVLDQVLAELGGELENHARRWSRHSTWMGVLTERLGGESGDIDQWAEEQEMISEIRRFIELRQGYLDREFEEIYGRYGHE